MNKTIISIICFVFAVIAGSSYAVAQQKRAFIVGISDYGNPNAIKDKWKNINGANDVQLLRPVLEKQGFRVTSLIDKEANYKNITDGLTKLTKECTSGDTVYLHFSMHGQLFEDTNGDEGDNWDEALIPIDAQMKFQKGVYEGDKHLIDDDLENRFNDMRRAIGDKGLLLVVMDACHAGTMSRGIESVRGVYDRFTITPKTSNRECDSKNSKSNYFELTSRPGLSPITVLEACRSGEKNYEIPIDKDTWYGSLSYYISKASESYEIGTQKWMVEVQNGMKKFSKDYNKKQKMVIESSLPNPMK